MNSKYIMILTLGNRDVQFTPKDFDNLPNKYYELFAMNTEGDKENYVINKARSVGKAFRDISKIVFDNKGIFEKYMVFPMLEASLSELEKEKIKPDKIILTTSKQEPAHEQDCDYFALLMQEHLKKKGYDCEIDFCSRNPTDFGEMTDYYTQLFTKWEKEGQLIISNSGGTPNMRSATHFAALFCDYRFITLSSKDKKNISNFGKQERLVLKNMAQSMLDVFDYEGVRQLPHHNKQIKQLTSYAIARIALDTDSMKHISEQLDDSDLYFPEEPTHRDFEKEILISALIKFNQQAYGDYLWRLFTFKDNVYIPDVEKLLEGKVKFEYGNQKAWNQLLKNKPDLLEYLETCDVSGTPLNYQAPGEYVYKFIIDFYINEKDYQEPKYYPIRTYIDKLKKLRNDIAHRYEGISLEKMDKAIAKASKPPINTEQFNQKLRSYLEMPDENDFGIYNVINQKILQLLG